MKPTRYSLGSILLWVVFSFAMLSMAPQARAQTAAIFVDAGTSTAADKCVIAANAALAGEYPVVANAYQGRRGCVVSAASVPTGPNSLTAALKSDLWGVLGVAVPFSFTRPTSADLTPVVIELIRQPQ